jgi:uncharacterized protein involved in exopolysaccharide biosynthesis
MIRDITFTAVITVVFVVGGWVITQMQDEQYTAWSVISVSDVSPLRAVRGNAWSGAAYIRNEASAVESQDVVNRAAAALGLDAAAVSRAISTVPNPTRDEIRVVATYGDRQLAAEIANGIVAAYEVSRTEEVAAIVDNVRRANDDLLVAMSEEIIELETADDAVAELERAVIEQRLLASATRVDEVVEAAHVYGAAMRVVREANPPRSPVRPDRSATLLVAAVLGLLTGAAVVFWRRSGVRSPSTA